MLVLLVLAAAQALHAFQMPGMPPYGLSSRRSNLRMDAARSKITSLDRTPNFPRIPSPSTDPDDRKKLARILEKSTALDLLAEQVTDAISDIGLHLGRDVDSVRESLAPVVEEMSNLGPCSDSLVVAEGGIRGERYSLVCQVFARVSILCKAAALQCFLVFLSVVKLCPGMTPPFSFLLVAPQGS